MDKHSIEKQIQHARPNLRTVSPLAHWILVIYATLNIALGISLILTVDQHRVSASLIIVNELFTYHFWGIVFILIGIFKFYAITTNNWLLARRSLLVGVSVKAAWAIALIVRILTSPGTVLITILWISLALIQIGTFIFFMPPAMSSKTREEQGDGSDKR